MSIRWDAYRAALPSIAHAVGRTPLVKLNRVTAGLTPPLYIRLEWYGATGSLKDRIYLHMFERAEARGELRPGMRVLECSTGNAGIACAFVSAMKGYPCMIVMPEGMSAERKKIVRAYGAELIFTPGGESDVDLSLRRLAEIRAGAPKAYWVPGQFDNADNVEAHYLTTAPEIWEQCDGRVGAFVDAQGSGGTLSGVGRFLRERDAAVRLYAVEPDECALLARPTVTRRAGRCSPEPAGVRLRRRPPADRGEGEVGGREADDPRGRGRAREGRRPRGRRRLPLLAHAAGARARAAAPAAARPHAGAQPHVHGG